MLLRDPEKHQAVAQAACARVRQEFCAEKIVPLYEKCYESVVGVRSGGSGFAIRRSD
jgi:hypothetical protein